MGANTRIASMPEKLPNISGGSRGFHGFVPEAQSCSHQLNIEDVDIQFEEPTNNTLPAIKEGGIVANGNHNNQRAVDEDEEDDAIGQVGEVIKVPQNEKYCAKCAEMVAMETGKLTEKLIELRLEGDRQRVQFDTMKRKLDNTSKELKTAQAMIQTLKDQNHEKANRIAKLTREATIGLWNREKKKLLQFADVREASLEYELESLKDSSQQFKDRALDRIQFLHDQVYKLKLRLNLQNSGNQMNKVLDAAEKKLASTKQELDAQKEEFFKFRKNMVGMLSGFHKDFMILTDQVDPETYEANAEFFDHAENFDRMLGDLHKAALTDNLSDTVERLPEQFSISESQKDDMLKRHRHREREKKKNEESDSEPQTSLSRQDSLSEAEILKKLESIENALHQSSQELKDFDEKMNDIDIADINDSGISLNDYEAMSRSRANSDVTRDTPTSSGFHDNRRSGPNDKTVRFENIETDANKIEANWKRRRGVSQNPKMTSKSVQTDKLPQLDLPQSQPGSRRGKRNRKGKPRDRSGSSTPTSKKKVPKKIDPSARIKEEQALQKQWLENQSKEMLNGDASPSKNKKKRNSPTSKNRQNSNITFTHLRDLYGEKKVTSLIDRVTGAVDVDMAAQQFPNLARAGIMEGFTHFVDHDSNNDYRLDINEVIRAISRATDQVVEQEEVKSALFELGVLETDELDFFDFLCIQETLTTGTFDKSKSKMLQMQGLNTNKKSTVSKYCAVM
ncbi:hypothetical protein ACHWQZ_G019138 [Mnemiopsis leidyi]